MFKDCIEIRNTSNQTAQRSTKCFQEVCATNQICQKVKAAIRHNKMLKQMLNRKVAQFVKFVSADEAWCKKNVAMMTR